VIHPGQPRAFGAYYAHDVRNTSSAPAISIHAYSRPLNEMNKYDLEGNRLVTHERASEWIDALDQELQAQRRTSANRTGVLSHEQMLSVARARLRRLSPAEAYEAAGTDAVLVDIRSEGQRAIEGVSLARCLSNGTCSNGDLTQPPSRGCRSRQVMISRRSCSVRKAMPQVWQQQPYRILDSGARPI
jgi:hypothetical protein